jgi:glycyl-radical enzyme activating protein
MMRKTKTMIFDIQKFSIHDGPGIRTTVFFKGCPLKCLWCSNPESQSAKPQLMHFEDRCTRCGDCIGVCPNSAISQTGDGEVLLDRQACDACGICIDECLVDARTISGREMTVEEICRIVEKDINYYQNSGGGVTISGGEPTSQPEFLLELLPKLRELGVHICLDTCGFAAWDVLEEALKFVDLVLLDNKHMDTKIHKELTGVNNELILENTKKIAGLGIPVIIRVPLIPGLNDSDENITQLGQFMKDCNLPRVDLLSYHRFSLSKHRALGFSYKLEDVPSPEEDEVRRVADILETFGREVTIV